MSVKGRVKSPLFGVSFSGQLSVDRTICDRERPCLVLARVEAGLFFQSFVPHVVEQFLEPLSHPPTTNPE